jgi:hypothetical protein
MLSSAQYPRGAHATKNVECFSLERFKNTGGGSTPTTLGVFYILKTEAESSDLDNG